MLIIFCCVLISFSGFSNAQYEVPASTDIPVPPTISVVIFSPVIQIIDVGETVRLPCTAYHNIRRIPITVVWRKADGSLPHLSYQDKGVLTITNVQHSDSGVYVCQAQSEEQYEQRVTINVGGGVAGKPQVELRPTHLDVDEYSPAEVECLATSPTSVTYHWSRLDDELSPDANINGQWLRFNQVNICREVSIQPASFSGRPGDSLVLTCRNVINVHATLIWNKAGLTQLPSHVDVRNGVLTIQNVRVEDGGRYTCTSSPSSPGQTIESITKVADVVITDYENDGSQSPNHPIYVKPLEQMYTAMQNSDFSLTCEASGNPYPTVSWKKIREDSLGSNVQQNGNTLKIFNVQPENRGVYQCKATSNGQTADTSTVIDVERREAPIVKIYPREPQTVNVGDSAMLSCRATGYPFPTVVWSRSDRAPLFLVEEPNVGTILISNITFAEQGEYECRASNLAGEASQTTVIHVQEPPMIRILPDTPEWTIDEGDELKLECYAEGSPSPTVKWKRPDRLTNEEQIIPGVKGYGRTATAQSLIQKYNADRSDEGTYICHAGNAAGEDEKKITISVQPKHGDVGSHVIDSRQQQPVRPIQPDNLSDYIPKYRINYRPIYPQPDSRPENRTQQYKVAVGEYTEISCEIEDFGKRTLWRRQDGSPLPSSSHLSGSVLVFDYIQEDAAGIYECVVHEPYGDLPIFTTEIIVVASQPVAPYVQLEPARSFLHSGDSIVVDCKSSSLNSTVTWKREGYQRLPSNFRQQGNQLIISNVQGEDAGQYICVCKTTNGQVSESKYELNIEIPPGRNEVKSAQIETAEAGSNIVLNCNPGRFANKYHWSRQKGHFAGGTDIRSSDLRLDNVQVKDAGTYICTASSGAQSSEIVITLAVTGAIPYFPQAPKSYLIFPKFENSYLRFNFEVTFNPDHANGLILYNAQRHGEGHYISLSLNDGYPEFRFDFGSEPVIVRAKKPIELRKWHTIKVNKVHKDGYLLVDDQHPVAFSQISRYGVELLENLYLGGVPNFNDVVSSAVDSHKGYVGCISRLILNDREIELKKEAIGSEGTTSCETCSDNVCANDGVCLETQTEEGFTCVCKSGFTGKTCAVEGLSCSPGICGTGRCENADFGIECFCPLNKTGDRCQFTEHLDESNLSFKDGSFVALKTPESTKLNIRFNVRPDNNQDSVLLYMAESEYTNRDFAALVVKDKHYEFRFNTDGRLFPVIIRSVNEVDVNKWTSISLGHRHGEGFLKIDNAPQVTGKAIGPAHTMYLKTNLYIGGYDKRILLNKGVEVNRGFDGCISGLEVSSQKIGMVKSLLYGANIHNCGDTYNIAQERANLHNYKINKEIVEAAKKKIYDEIESAHFDLSSSNLTGRFNQMKQDSLKEFDGKKLGENEISGGFREHLNQDLNDFHSALTTIMQIYAHCMRYYSESMQISLDAEDNIEQTKIENLHKITKNEAIVKLVEEAQIIGDINAAILRNIERAIDERFRNFEEYNNEKRKKVIDKTNAQNVICDSIKAELKENITRDIESIDLNSGIYELIKLIKRSKVAAMQEFDMRKTGNEDFSKSIRVKLETDLNDFQIALIDTMVEYQNYLDQYSNVMVSSINLYALVRKEDELIDTHKRAKYESVSKFLSESKLDHDELNLRLKQILENSIEDKFSTIAAENERKIQDFIGNGHLHQEIMEAAKKKICNDIRSELFDLLTFNLTDRFNKIKQDSLNEFESKKRGENEISSGFYKNLNQDLNDFHTSLDTILQKYTKCMDNHPIVLINTRMECINFVTKNADLHLFGCTNINKEEAAKFLEKIARERAVYGDRR